MTSTRLARTFNFACVRLMVAAGLFLVAQSNAALAADDDPSSDLDSGLKLAEEHAWTVGVPKGRQEAANQLYLAGNALFLESLFKPAMQKYRDALAQWDHPTVHYNLALALINLDNPIEAHKHMQEAMKFGGAPLDERRQKKAQEELKRTSREISTLEISSREAGSTVSLDGRDIVTPGRLLLAPGEHAITARKAGYEPREYRVGLYPGKPEKLETRLYAKWQLEKESSPLPFWIPVAVTATGVAMVVTGAVLGTHARNARDDFDKYATQNCPGRLGCDVSETHPERLDLANTLDTWSTISYVAGAVTVTGGAVWMWFNRTKTQKLTPEQLDHQTTLAPAVTSSMLGAVAKGRF